MPTSQKGAHRLVWFGMCRTLWLYFFPVGPVYPVPFCTILHDGACAVAASLQNTLAFRESPQCPIFLAAKLTLGCCHSHSHATNIHYILYAIPSLQFLRRNSTREVTRTVLACTCATLHLGIVAVPRFRARMNRARISARTARASRRGAGVELLPS